MTARAVISSLLFAAVVFVLSPSCPSHYWQYII